MKRTYLLLALAIIVSLLVAACGATKVPTAVPKATQPPVTGPEFIVIGTSAPLTGMFAGFGQGCTFGAQAAVDDINAAGGIFVKEYNRKMDELGQERTQAFEQAVEQTRKILTPEQAGKYDALLKKQREQSPGEPSGLRPPWGEGRRPRPGSEEGTPEKEAVPRGGE